MPDKPDGERLAIAETKIAFLESAFEDIDGKLDKILQRKDKSNRGMIIITLMNATLMLATIGVVVALLR